MIVTILIIVTVAQSNEGNNPTLTINVDVGDGHGDGYDDVLMVVRGAVTSWCMIIRTIFMIIIIAFILAFTPIYINIDLTPKPDQSNCDHH